ncbi:ferric reductase-like transmembrane domain-containing protein [Crossiella sp. SN42]|uniref:ferric reductase-like transmembrane domain-containing protein n=1 Tax=Crossiella sp. SN42 TaxID=2944808 RepID=UPI00207D4BB4|nr:ferric reductase-like transmembrane domain-containing protein [Crossiella sp. SN42]MCO1577982.1 ferric reductase-like transmembrane domain-containing protein [Crossiella sp. SN42]
MPHHPVLQLAASTQDEGVRAAAALSGWLAYGLLCLTLCWGVFTSAGWVRRATGRQTVRSGHLLLATVTLAFVLSHVLTLLSLREERFGLVNLLFPAAAGAPLRQALGALAFELMLVVALSVALRRLLGYRRWLWLHRLAYPAALLGVAHVLLGALAGGRIALLWLAGVTLVVPVLTLAVLRFLPARVLVSARIIEEAP